MHAFIIVNRPGVAGAVLQTSLSPIDSVSESVILFLQTFETSLHPNRKTWEAEIFGECSPPHQMSHIMCLV